MDVVQSDSFELARQVYVDALDRFQQELLVKGNVSPTEVLDGAHAIVDVITDEPAFSTAYNALRQRIVEARDPTKFILFKSFIWPGVERASRRNNRAWWHKIGSVVIEPFTETEITQAQ